MRWRRIRADGRPPWPRRSWLAAPWPRRLCSGGAAPIRPRAVVPPLELTPGHRGGAGTPLLLLHGVGAIWRAWSPVLPYLESHHDVIVPTLAGHGGGPPLDPQVAPSVQALADALEEELDKLGLQKVHIAGNSLGGWLGMELARRGRARSLVLFSPAGAWHSQRGIELRASAIRLSVGALGPLCAPRRHHRRQRASALASVGRAGRLPQSRPT